MRIGVDARPLSNGHGGIRYYTEQLIRGLSRVDDRNQYVLYGPPVADAGSYLPDRFAWDGCHFPLKSVADSIFVAGANQKLDLYHGTNYSTPLLSRFPTVITVHDLTVVLHPSCHPLKRRLRHRLVPAMCARSACVIADSFATKGDLIRLYGVPSGKIEVIYLAAGAEYQPVVNRQSLETVRQRYRLPERFVLYLGSVEPRKNLPSLIRAMAALRRHGLPQRLVIAGRGSSRYLLQLRELVCAEGLEPDHDVVFTGEIHEDDLPTLYSLADLFVFPSLAEGFGLPPLEAMACGTPVLLPDNSCFTELYRDCGMVVNLDHPERMAGAIGRVLVDLPLQDQLIEQGLKRARSRSWDDTAAETLAVYLWAARQP